MPRFGTTNISALALLLGMSACLGDGEGSSSYTLTGLTTTVGTSLTTGTTLTMEEETTGDGDGDGDGSPGDGDGDGSDNCHPLPEECEVFLRCIAAISPDQLPAIEDEYGEGGSCWCNGDQAAQACLSTCVEQVAVAIENFPTESACHESVCSLDELDPDQPYGPIVNGSCSDYINEQNQAVPQIPLANPLGLPGGFCSPACWGVAETCPNHTQTTADGTCYLAASDTNYCVSRCWVDPLFIGGTQCQCGATCQPHGAPDGEGNMRGICTFE